MERVWKYVEDIKSGKISSCQAVKNSISRFEKDLKRDDIYFDEKEVKKVLIFIESLQHGFGEYKGTQFTLENWQVFIIANIFGWYWVENNTRRFKESFVQVARGNGKTPLMAALAMYVMVSQMEYNAEIHVVANSKGQSKDTIFRHLKHFRDYLDPKKKIIRPYHDSFIVNKTQTYLQVMTADASTKAGFATDFAVMDEVYALRDQELIELFRSSAAKKLNSHITYITTAGSNTNNPAFEMYQTGMKILDGTLEDDSLFTIIYELDEEDDLIPENFIKANPNLGITVKEETLKDAIVKAKNMPSKEGHIRVYSFNQWMNTKDVWLNERIIQQMFDKDLKIEDFYGQTCWIGIDLAHVRDTTAVVALFEGLDGMLYAFPKLFIPYDTVHDRVDKSKWIDWQRRKMVEITPGGSMDFDYVANYVEKLQRNIYINTIHYDRYGFDTLLKKFEEKNLVLEKVQQSKIGLTTPTKELEKKILDNKIKIQNNSLVKEHFRNTYLDWGVNAMVKPEKISKTISNDGVIALLLSFNAFLHEPKYEGPLFF